MAVTKVSFGLILAGVLLNAVAQLALKASVRDLGAINLSLAGSSSVAGHLFTQPWLWFG